MSLAVTPLDEATLVRKALQDPNVWSYVVMIGKLIDIDADYIPKVIADCVVTLRQRMEKARTDRPVVEDLAHSTTGGLLASTPAKSLEGSSDG